MAASAPPLLSKIVVTGSILAFHTAGAQALVIYGFSGEVPITSNSASATDGIRVGDEYDDGSKRVNPSEDSNKSIMIQSVIFARRSLPLSGGRHDIQLPPRKQLWPITLTDSPFPFRAIA